MANHKKYYDYRGGKHTIEELSAMSGYSTKQLRNRLYRGFSIEQAMREVPMHDSVVAFDEASYWGDWIGMAIEDLYQIYWKWCVNNDWHPVTKRQLSSELLPRYGLQTVSMATPDGKSQRYVRERTFRDQFGRLL